MFLNPIRTTIPRLLVCFFCLIGAGTMAAQTQSPWVLRTSGTPQSLSGITFGAGLYVAVGDEGAILSSPDAVTWIPRSSGTTVPLRGICFAAGRFVAVGGSGTILTSTDAVTWTPRTSSTSLFLSGVAYGAGKFAAVGAFGMLVTSEDGIAWTAADSTAAGLFLQGVMFANGLFLAYGQEGALADGELHGTVRASSNGTEWTTVTLPVSSDVYAATFFRGRFYTGGIYGECFSSADLLLWRQEDLGVFTGIRSMATDGHTLVAVSESGGIHASTDGVAWTAITSGVTSTLFGVTFSTSKFVAVGDVTAGQGTILSSLQDPVITAYDAWKMLKFTEAEQADPNISGPNADAEPDGLPNLVEFAHGLEPKVADFGSDRLLALRFLESYETVELRWTYDTTAAESVTMVVRYSDDLTPTSWRTLLVKPENFSSDGDLQTVIAFDKTSQVSSRFYRLKYTLTE